MIWPFSNASLGALALVVGTAAEYGSFESFKTFVSINASFDVVHPSSGPGLGGTLAFSVGGSKLQVKHSGLSSYRMINGATVEPAGGYPEVEFEGKTIEFSSFDSYGVVEGDPVLTQPWGVGNLTVQTDSGGYRVRVDG